MRGTFREETRPAKIGGPLHQINLPDSVYDLSEVNEEAVQAAILEKTGSPSSAVAVKLAARRDNMYRRAIARYEPNILVPAFTCVAQRFKTDIAEAAAILKELEETLTKSAPPRIIVTATVSNRGQRPVALLDLGVLKLNVPDQGNGQSTVVSIPLKSESEDIKVFVVDGGRAEVVSLVSAETLSEIVSRNTPLLGGEQWSASKPVEESRLMMLYKAKVGQLSASVVLAAAGRQPNDSRIGESGIRVVGPSARDAIIDNLSR